MVTSSQPVADTAMPWSRLLPESVRTSGWPYIGVPMTAVMTLGVSPPDCCGFAPEPPPPPQPASEAIATARVRKASRVRGDMLLIMAADSML
jgi:hypothetical protein